MFASNHLFDDYDTPPYSEGTPKGKTKRGTNDDKDLMTPQKRMQMLKQQSLAKRKQRMGSQRMLRNHQSEDDLPASRSSMSSSQLGTPGGARGSTMGWEDPEEKGESVSGNFQTLMNKQKREVRGGPNESRMSTTEMDARARGLNLTYDPNQGSRNEQQTSEKTARLVPKLNITDVRHFLNHPAPQKVQAYIKRVKAGFRVFPTYEMYLTNGDRFLMSAKKRTKNKTSNYIISMDKQTKKEGVGYLGKLRSNFVGTEFVIYNNGANPAKAEGHSGNVREELGAVLYEPNILGSKGPRKMVVIIPCIRDGSPTTFRPVKPEESIVAVHKNGETSNVVVLGNKSPKWNDAVGAYVLNFNGRVTMASVKNFQLVEDEEDDDIMLQFGRVGKDVFNVDFQYPMSPLQAFSICLSSFDYKFACE